MENKEWRNAKVWQDLEKDRTTKAAYLTDHEYNFHTIWNWLDESVNYRQGIIELKKQEICRNLIAKKEKKTGNL